MILINIKTNEAYSNIWIAEASRKIGISTKQISRWINNNSEPFEKFNDWILYFKEVRLKQRTGFELNKSNIKYIKNN